MENNVEMATDMLEWQRGTVPQGIQGVNMTNVDLECTYDEFTDFSFCDAIGGASENQVDMPMGTLRDLCLCD